MDLVKVSSIDGSSLDSSSRLSSMKCEEQWSLLGDDDESCADDDDSFFSVPSNILPPSISTRSM